MKRYIVILSAEERQSLLDLIAAGKGAAQKLAHARILLKADAVPGRPAWADAAIAEAVEVSVATVERVRPRFVEQGQSPAQARWPRRGPVDRPGLLEASGRSQRVDDATAGRHARRTGDRRFHLRRDRAADASKNELKPWLKEQWCLPPEANAEFVAAMEDVRDVYERPCDPNRPFVCLDEASKQLIGEVAARVPAEPGQPE